MSFNIKPGVDYWIGGSSDPDHVLITRFSPGTVRYKEIPIERESQEITIDEASFRLLAMKGMKTRIDHLEQFLKTERAHAMPDEESAWAKEQVGHMRAVQRGDEVPLQAETDYLALSVKVKAVSVPCDPWAYLDSLTGGCCNSHDPATGIYEVSVIGVSELVRLQGDPRIKVWSYDYAR